MQKCDFTSYKWKFPVRPAAENVNIIKKVMPDHLHQNSEDEIRGSKQSKENRKDPLWAQTNKDVPIGS